ncbi:hypothetical protein HDV00_000553 [Rhizophlyctis rosea]|nr:hypothetical protein HDV00_000553 [Rhizophlyctis rosea]
MSKLHINTLLQHVLESVFEYLQPYIDPDSLDQINFVDVTDKTNANGEPTVYRRPMELHLAQICRYWRSLAFGLRGGDCIDISSYPSNPFSGGEDPDKGYRIFIADRLRARSVKRLEFPEDFTEGSISISTYRYVFYSVSVGNLRELLIDRVAAPLLLEEVAEHLYLSRESLRLHTFLLILRTGVSKHRTSFNTLLSALECAPLVDLTLHIFELGTERPLRLRFKRFPRLRRLQISNSIVLADLPVTAPLLESYTIICVKQAWHPSLSYLSQSTLRQLMISRSVDRLKTIPSSTLKNLTRITVHTMAFCSPSASDSNFNQVLKPFTMLHKCIALHIRLQWPGSEGYDPDQWCFYLRIERLFQFVTALPCRHILESFEIPVKGWDTGAVIDAVKCLPKVKDVCMKIEGGGVAQSDCDLVKADLKGIGVDFEVF